MDKFFTELKSRIESEAKKIGDCKRNDHYVPKLLLKNFALSEKDGRKTGLIFQYKRGGGKVERKSIRKKAACEIGFYDTINKLSKKPDNLADRLNQITESEVARVIEKLNSEDNLHLANREENILAAFVAELYTRTPAFREQIKRYLLYLIENKIIKKEDLGEEKIIEEIFFEDKLKIKTKKLIKFKPTMELEFRTNSLLIVIAFAIAARLSKKLFFRNINILNSSSGSFLIGDSPVFSSNLRDYPRWPLGWDFKKDDAIFLPISPSRCLVYDRRKFKNKLVRAKKSLVNFINFSQIINAESYIYSNESREYIQECLNSTKKMREYAF